MKRETNELERAYQDYQKQIRAIVHTVGEAKEAFRLAFKAERERKRISLRKAAERMKISAPYLYDIESGRRDLTVSIFQKMRKVLD